MAGYTKAGFDAVGNHRLERMIMAAGVNLDVHPEPKPSVERPEVRLHYHSFFWKPILSHRWDSIVPGILNILPTDRVVLMGAAFGWGVEKLAAMTGATVVGLEISDYVDTAKDVSEDADVIDAIRLAGLDETTGRGLAILEFVSNPGPRSTATIFKEDLLTPESRQRVKTGMNNFDPDWIITEDMMQDLTVAQGAILVDALNTMSATKVHIISRENLRTLEEINVFTGHKAILTGENRVVG